MGEIRPALELARFQNKVEKERPETSQPKATPWELFATNIRPEWAKELLFRSLPLPLCSGGCYSFAPFGGVSMLHPLPPGVARGWHINAPSGRREPNVQADMLSA